MEGDGDAVGDLQQLVEFGGDPQHSTTTIGELEQGGPKLGSRCRVETPRRLAGDDDDRFAVQFASRDELLGVATRQRIGEVFGCPLDRPGVHPRGGHGIASDPPRGAAEGEVVVASHRADEGTQGAV